MNSIPSTGKRKTSRTIIIPIIRQVAEKETIQILLFNFKKDTPKARPNKPVVKGKTISSLGSIINNRKIVRI